MAEMLGVVVVIGMIAGTAAISWKSVLPRTQLNSAVRALGSLLHGTRSDAVARNAEFRMVYDLDQNRYWVSSPFKLGGGLALEEEERHIYGETSLPAGITFTEVVIDGRPFNDGQVQVRFSPMGTASDHSIQLRQEVFQRDFTIEVLALTGIIRFHKGVWAREIPRDGAFD
jgi:Tfp pilus assembly protein FimT